MKYHPTPERYIVTQSYSYANGREEVVVGYSTRLDNLNNMPKALFQATLTAERYGGELAASYADGSIIQLGSYRSKFY